MTEAITSFLRRALVCACLSLAAASPGFAQRAAPLAEPPQTAEFLSRYDFHLEGSYLGSGDPARFQWDTHWGGDADIVDYVAGRIGILADYQAVIGDEMRAFDPNQGNYTLEVSGSGRIGRTELAGAIHHVSRHLSDRPKDFPIAMNVLEARVLRRFEPKDWSIDLVGEIGHILKQTYTDYSWVGNLDVTARRPLSQVVSGYGRMFGEFYGIDPELSDRDTQRGARLEGGIRVRGRVAALEMFAGWTQVVDADPLDRQTRRWPFVGLRIVN